MDERDHVADARFLTQLREEGYDELRPIRGPDGGLSRWAGLYRFAFTWAIIVGKMGDLTGYDDRWCYHDEAAARRALEAWSGRPGTEPEGWHRHPLSGRRRDVENGTEWVSW